jgi:hypothetical protein
LKPPALPRSFGGGKVAEGTAPAGKRSGFKFEDAFADYLDYLERKAASKGKAASATPANHAARVMRALYKRRPSAI